MTKTKEATPFKCKLRRKIFDLVKAVLKSAAIRPLLEAYICFTIKKINKNLNPEIGVLVLDEDRFWPGDLERLGERTQLWELPTNLRTFLHALFFTTDEMHLIRTYKNITPSFLEKEKLFTEWFRNLVEKIGKRKGFNCILTCNYLYVQNRLIAKACQNSSIPFINHSRENCLDKRVNQVFKDLFNAQGFDSSFHGTALCVYNHNMKDFLCDLNVISPEKIHVVGSLRTDMLVKRLKNIKKLPTKKQVTLFSFFHGVAECMQEKNSTLFSSDGKEGLVKLFDSVHGSFAELADANPDTNFVIKAKFGGEWFEVIRESLKKRGFSLDNMKNVTLMGADGDAIEEIIKSTVVIGINSTTMLQARIAGKIVVEPRYEEIADKYAKSLHFRDVESEFDIVSSEEELKKTVQNYIDNPETKDCKEGVFDDYIGFTDGKNLDRIMNVMKKVVKTNGCVQ